MGATWRKRGKASYLVTVHLNGGREFKTVHSKADAEALVREIHRQELAGVNVVDAIRAARAERAQPAAVTSYPTLRSALEEWLTGQEAAGELRASTVSQYRQRCQHWLYPYALPDGRLLGDVPVNDVTREMLGGLIRKIKEAGRSITIRESVRGPVRRLFESLIEAKSLPAGHVNPAADLKHFMGRRQRRGKQSRSYAFFGQEEVPQLVATAKPLTPRWTPFILTGLLAGLRWGETAALQRADIDWRRGRIHVQRTISRSSMPRIEACKDGDDRWVKASPALLVALRSHCDAMELEASVNGWTPEQRQWVFPNREGRPVAYTRFVGRIWRPLLRKAGLPYRKYHSTRHSFATHLLESGADLRWVSEQLGHATLALTADVYGHCQPDRHESVVAGLDRLLTS